MAIRKGLGRGTGKGYRNIIGKDPRVHSDSARGRKQPQRLDIPLIPKNPKQNVWPKHRSGVPYSDKVKFYANQKTKEIIVVQKIDIGKGWVQHIVGDFVETTRNYRNDDLMLSEHYPDFKPISLFSETSYHSGINKKGKITNYGTSDYNLGWSDYKPIGKYKLLQPVKTTLKKNFGKEINDVTLQEWNYVVIDWIPDDKTKLQIKHKISDGFGKEKTLFKSRKYDLSDKNQVIKEFKLYINSVAKFHR